MEYVTSTFYTFGFLLWLGRGAKEAFLYTEICEGIHAYGITRHRHGEFLSAYIFLRLL